MLNLNDYTDIVAVHYALSQLLNLLIEHAPEALGVWLGDQVEQAKQSAADGDIDDADQTLADLEHIRTVWNQKYPQAAF